MLLKLLFIKSLPSVSMNRLNQLPKQPAVYYACAKWRVLYVGMSGNLYLRWNSKRYGDHHQLAEIKARGGDRLHYRVMPLHWVKYFEAKEIQTLKPPLNRVYPNPMKLMTARIFVEQLGLTIGFGLALLFAALCF